MNFKLKTLVAVLALSAAAATSANAANAASLPNTGNSSLVFSAWNVAGTSYSIDLGNFLNDFIGADTATTTAGSTTNTIVDANATYTGTVAADGTIFDKVLTGWNLGTSAVWNMAAGDGFGRQRLLISEAGAFTGVNNAPIKSANAALGTYLGYGAAASTTTGTTSALTTDLWNASGSSWGDDMSASGIAGTSNALGSSSNLYVLWQKSISSTQAQSASGFANLISGGNNVFATTYVDTLGATHFKIATVAAIAAVPEADTSGMMLAGLGLMGFIARRRNRKQA